MGWRAVRNVSCCYSDPGFARAYNLSDDGGALCVLGLQTLQYRIPILPRHTQQETAARLRIRQQPLFTARRAVPCSEFVCKVTILAAAAGDATGSAPQSAFPAQH